MRTSHLLLLLVFLSVIIDGDACHCVSKKLQYKFGVAVVSSAKDLYGILGVPKTATDRQIKKAYRKLALKYHPDKNDAKGAKKKFVEIGKGATIFSDQRQLERREVPPFLSVQCPH